MQGYAERVSGGIQPLSGHNEQARTLRSIAASVANRLRALAGVSDVVRTLGAMR